MKGIIAAFAMFSRIPMPCVRLDEKDMRYCMAALPLVGVVIGICEWLADLALRYLEITGMARGVFLAVVPVMISGGIHLDGFCDVSDANSSWCDEGRKLEIMKDPHIGAFALIRCVYAAGLYAAIVAQLDKTVVLLCATYGFSRAIGAMLTILLKPAKDTGMMALEHKLADVRVNVSLLALQSLALVIFMWLAGGLAGICCAAVGLACSLVCAVKGNKDFGGFTGDVAGWLIVNVELCMAAALMVLEKI